MRVSGISFPDLFLCQHKNLSATAQSIIHFGFQAVFLHFDSFHPVTFQTVKTIANSSVFSLNENESDWWDKGL